MITEWFLSLGATIIEWVLRLFDDIKVPGWILTFDDTWNAVVEPLDGLSAWVPWTVVIGITVFCLTTWFVCLVIKYCRAIASYIPLFGGAG